MKWLRVVLHAVGRFALTVVFGIAPVKPIRAQQCLVVANHNTHLDILVLLRLFPLGDIHKVRVIAAADYFSKGLTGLCARTLLPLILIDRHAKKADTAIDPVEEALIAGYSIIIFPEGSRGAPGELQPFKTGIGKLAMDFPDLPVYPVLLEGIEKTLPRGKMLPVPFTIRLKTASPLYGRDFLADSPSRGRKTFTSALEATVRNLQTP